MKVGTEDLYLSGFENDSNGKGNCFNFILSNGLKSKRSNIMWTL